MATVNSEFPNMMLNVAVIPHKNSLCGKNGIIKEQHCRYGFETYHTKKLAIYNANLIFISFCYEASIGDSIVKPGL